MQKTSQFPALPLGMLQIEEFNKTKQKLSVFHVDDHKILEHTREMAKSDCAFDRSLIFIIVEEYTLIYPGNLIQFYAVLNRNQ